MGKLFIENDTHYEFINTDDGSPSICYWSKAMRPEAMHHRKGAFSESLFIYRDALEVAIQAYSCKPRVLSIGLGCGYNELISAAYFATTLGDQTDVYIESFEGDPILRQAFLSWLTDGAPPLPLAQNGLVKQLNLVFTNVNQLVASHFGLTAPHLKKILLQLHQNHKFVLREWLNFDTQFDVHFGTIFYDAFSNQSTPQIWQEFFLDNFLKMVADHNCVLATYSATGAMNRSLRKAGFIMQERPGFAGKRQSTRAVKQGKTGICSNTMIGSAHV